MKRDSIEETIMDLLNGSEENTDLSPKKIKNGVDIKSKKIKPFTPPKFEK